MNKLIYLKKIKKHIEYYNLMSPFPIYDSEYVKEVNKLIDNMENNVKNINYDELPVEACKYCNNLALIIDEYNNDICTRCGSINETLLYKNIKEYLNKTKDK